MQTRRPGMVGLIERNGWAILAAAFALYGGWITGQTTIETRLARLEEIAASNASRLNGRADFMVCAVRQMDQIHDALDITPPCALEVED